MLTTDPFSFTMFGQPWLTQSWLAELFYSWGEQIFDLGYVGPMILVLGSLLFLGIGLIAYRRSQSLVWTLVMVFLTAAIFLGFLVPRPVIFSYVLSVAVVLAGTGPRLAGRCLCCSGCGRLYMAVSSWAWLTSAYRLSPAETGGFAHGSRLGAGDPGDSPRLGRHHHADPISPPRVTLLLSLQSGDARARGR